MPGAKNWVFTLNANELEAPMWTNAGVEEAPVIIYDPATMEYCQYQVEKGAHVHLQGFCLFKKRLSLTALKKINDKAHWEMMRGTVAHNLAYCSKDQTKVAGPWKWGVCHTQGRPKKLDAAIEAINNGATMADIAKEHQNAFIHFNRGLTLMKAALNPSPAWRDLHVHFIHGPTGSGKTRHCYDEDPNLFQVHSDGKWWDGYEDQTTILFDDFYGQIRCADMLHYLDGYPINALPIKGGFVSAHWTKIFITSNVEPKEIYHLKDVTEPDSRGIPEEVFKAFMRRIHKVTQIGITDDPTDSFVPFTDWRKI